MHYRCNSFSITFLESTRLHLALELFYSISIPLHDLYMGPAIRVRFSKGEHVVCFFSYTTENLFIVFPTSALLPLFSMTARLRLSQVAQCEVENVIPRTHFYYFSHDGMPILKPRSTCVLSNDDTDCDQSV
jgi:hypothetical protein